MDNIVLLLTSCFITCSRLIGAGLAIFGMSGAGVGIGLVFAVLISAISRNPSKEDVYFRNAILGFALVEAMGLLALMMAFLIVYAF